MATIQTKFRIDVFPGFSKIFPYPPDDVRSNILEQACWHVESVSGSLEFERLNEPFWDFDCLGQFVFPTGLMELLRQELRMAGNSVKVVERRKFSECFQIAPELLSNVVGPVEVFLKTTQLWSQGVVEVESFDQSILFIEEAIRLYPKANTLVLAGNRDMATDIRYRLENNLKRKIPIRRRGFKLPQKRLVVSTYHRVNLDQVDRWDLILLADPISAMQDRGCRMMADLSFGNNHVYAFLNAGQKLTRRRAMRLKSFVGPPVLRQLGTRVDVDFLPILTPSCKKPCLDSYLDWKRTAYLMNDHRNDFVASVARDFKRGNVRRLARYGISASNGSPQIRHGKSPIVIVVADGERHANELQLRLRDWPVFTSGSDSQFPKGTKNAIATISFIAEVGASADVYVLASGDLTQIDEKKFLPKRTTNIDKNCLVVDFEDAFDSLTLERSQQRVQNANRKQWNLFSITKKKNGVK